MEPRKRGVRLSDLDRGHRYVIGHTGRRWEVVEDLGPDAAGPPPLPGEGGRAPARSTGPGPGRHAATDPDVDLPPDPWGPGKP
jgi:hypothetical protein